MIAQITAAEIITGFDQRTMNKIKVPIALMGIGHYGLEDTNKYGFDQNSKLIWSYLNKDSDGKLRGLGFARFLEKKKYSKIARTIVNNS